MSDFPYRHQPRDYQREELQQTVRKRGWCQFWEQGTGKTYIAINTIAYHFLYGRTIDAALIIAPNNVHINWTTDEIPKHMPECVPYLAHNWHTPSAVKTRKVDGKEVKTYDPALAALLAFPDLAVLTMNMEAVLSPKSEKYLRKFLATRRVAVFCDEADEFLASPNSKRFKRVLAYLRQATMVRVMTGTPSEEAPLNIYGIMLASDETFWKRHGIRGYPEYKNKICEYALQTIGVDKQITKIVGYKNLDWLSRVIKTGSSRVLKNDVLKDLPPKIYEKYHVELSPEQRRMYRELRETFRTNFADGGMVTADITVTRMLRFQQIVCGYLPEDLTLLDASALLADEDVGEEMLRRQERPLKPIPGGSESRLSAVDYLLHKVPGKTIIWARFTQDIDQLLARLGPAWVRYDGQVDRDTRLSNKRRYLDDPSCRGIVANQRAMGRGETLVNTQHMIFYSNLFGARPRAQAEDRAHRFGLQHPVLITDLVALNTVDVHIINTLRRKRSVSQAVMDDPQTEWI